MIAEVLATSNKLTAFSLSLVTTGKSAGSTEPSLRTDEDEETEEGCLGDRGAAAAAFKGGGEAGEFSIFCFLDTLALGLDSTAWSSGAFLVDFAEVVAAVSLGADLDDRVEAAILVVRRSYSYSVIN